MPIHSVYTISKDDPEARNWLAFFRRHGYAGLSNLLIERVFWLEGNINRERLMPLLAAASASASRWRPVARL